jgi:hypothetical protein
MFAVVVTPILIGEALTVKSPEISVITTTLVPVTLPEAVPVIPAVPVPVTAISPLLFSIRTSASAVTLVTVPLFVIVVPGAVALIFVTVAQSLQ